MPVEAVEPRDLPEALARILAPSGVVRARRAQVRGFLAYLEHSPCDFICLRHTAEPAYLLALLVPGRTCVLMLSDPGKAATAHEEVLAAWMVRANDESFHYQQCLLDPQAGERRALVTQRGFTHLTRLHYLERSATYPWVEPEERADVRWRTHEEIGDDAFAALLPQTYEDSADCPELCGRRPIESVLASHKAAGVFDPALWLLLECEGKAAGCLLLSRLPQAAILEVVYMGLAKPFRGRGLGRALLEQAVLTCQVHSLGQLTLVVDARNTAACELYEGFGFQRHAERDAFLRFDSDDSAVADDSGTA